MSWITFELQKEHVAMIKAINWDAKAKCIFEMDDEGRPSLTAGTPFGGEDLMEDLGFIIYGLPDYNPLDDDPLSPDGATYTPEQVANMVSLYMDLPRALEVTSNLSSFELGTYRRRFHKRDWSQKKEKKS